MQTRREFIHFTHRKKTDRLFMVMAFAETLEKEWTKAGLRMITLQQRSHSPQDIGKLTGHKVKNARKEIH